MFFSSFALQANPHRSSRSRARLTLRALKQVSEGVRPKFETTGYLIKPGQLKKTNGLLDEE